MKYKVNVLNFFIVLTLINFTVNNQAFSKTRYKRKASVKKVIKTQSTEYIKKDKIYDFYDTWKGTRYRLGGTTRRGVDCSSFVQNLYREKFAVKLPRSTSTQALEGYRISSRKDWKVGDLVFFRINRRVKHVGVYIGGNKFVHSGSSTGVTISRLDDAYWSRRHWQTRRIIK